jgi:hypothetical protein
VNLRPRSTATYVLFICSIAVVFLRLRQSYDGSWSPISTIMFHPWEAPVFAHRLLFVGVAWLFRLVLPSLDVVYCYYLSQIVALLWSFSMVGLLVREIVGCELEFGAYPLLSLMLIPTLRYFTFYDIGIAGFHAACLVLLLKERHALFLATFAVGIFNHENLLLMAPVGVLYTGRSRNYRKAIVLAVGTIGIYVSSRYLLQIVLPSDRSFDWRMTQNLHPLAYYGFKRLFDAAVALLLPFCSIAVGFRYSHTLLKIATPVVLFGLAVIVQLFGQWSEPRQFDAMFALAVPMLLSSTRKTGACKQEPQFEL